MDELIIKKQFAPVIILLMSLMFGACEYRVKTPAPPKASTQFRVVTYNVSNNPDDDAEDAYLAAIFTAIESLDIQGNQLRPQIISVQETDTASSQRLADLLNTIYEVDSYALEVSGSVGGYRTAIIYDSASFDNIVVTELTGAPFTRPLLRVQLQPVGKSESMYVYAIHLKSGSSTSDIDARELEAQAIAADAMALNDGVKLFLGDFNWKGASEPAWVSSLAYRLTR